MSQIPFHLAFPVRDLDATEDFYVNRLGCTIGRRDTKWIDFNFFGHQISAHLGPAREDAFANPVDTKMIPIPHFGAVLPWARFHQLADHLRAAETTFIHEPQIRFEGQVGEQAIMFLRDPAGNVLEFKSFRDPDNLFAS
ncbi:VOC family protein [Acanthopleuribacter pedis]|uniref:VOC domain-containing protein n=1 Tax=Acanthopleuribacter pedis TaxID=442870 RepID=A0A8J7QSN7_9BACT|nr:VOC family protein [Acanthopleuribacter pedis]MBO1323078.1 hypothetical protein [Acanthopleuribacter pedis]